MDKTLTLTSFLEPNDDIDSFLLEDVLLIVQNTNTLELIKFATKSTNKLKHEQNYLLTIISVIKSLYKANHHRRSYKRYEKEFYEQLLKESLKAETAIDLIYSKFDLSSEVDSFLAQIKASLDMLATSLNPLFGLKIHGWHKKHNKSGQEILDILERQLPKDKLVRTAKLRELVDKNIEYITKIVSLRDQPLHKGGLDALKGFRYVIKEKKLYKPHIVYSEKEVEYVSDFLDKTMSNFVKFTQWFIVLSLSSIIPNMELRQGKDKKFNWYASNLPKPKPNDSTPRM